MTHPATIDIEYVGDPPIMDEIAKYRIAQGLISDKGAAVLRAADASRLKAIPGLTKRIVDQGSFGTSRDYQFGPEVFVVAVEWEDAKKIMDSESGNQFRRMDEQRIIIPQQAVISFAEEHEINRYDVYQRKP